MLTFNLGTETRREDDARVFGISVGTIRRHSVRKHAASHSETAMVVILGFGRHLIKERERDPEIARGISGGGFMDS